MDTPSSVAVSVKWKSGWSWSTNPELSLRLNEKTPLISAGFFLRRASSLPQSEPITKSTDFPERLAINRGRHKALRDWWRARPF